MKIIFKIAIFYVLVILATNSYATEAKEMYRTANKLYSQDKYDSALVLYQELVDNGYMTSGVLYNIGNTWFRKGDLAEAIVNYERASLIAPFNKDIRFNLELANTRIIDRVEVIPPFFLKRWALGFIHLFLPAQWGWIFIGVLTSVLFSFFLFLFSSNYKWRRLYFYFSGGLFILMVLTALAGFFRKIEFTDNSEAIISVPQVNILSSPSDSGKDIFILHEGTKVKILDNEISGWYEIRIADGNTGWTRSNNVLEILPEKYIFK